MRCIRIKPTPQSAPRYVAGIGDARKFVRTFAKTFWWDMEIDTPTDKAAVLSLMNGDEPAAVETGRAWQVTERGALKESAE